MSHQASIDALDALHYIVIPGIKRQGIFSVDQNQDNFIDRLAAHCYRYPNLLFRLGANPQSCPYFIEMVLAETAGRNW